MAQKNKQAMFLVYLSSIEVELQRQSTKYGFTMSPSRLVQGGKGRPPTPKLMGFQKNERLYRMSMTSLLRQIFTDAQGRPDQQMETLDHGLPKIVKALTQRFDILSAIDREEIETAHRLAALYHLDVEMTPQGAEVR